MTSSDTSGSTSPSSSSVLGLPSHRLEHHSFPKMPLMDGGASDVLEKETEIITMCVECDQKGTARGSDGIRVMDLSAVVTLIW